MWNMAFCVTSMINLNVLLIHLLASLPKLYHEIIIRTLKWIRFDWLIRMTPGHIHYSSRSYIYRLLPTINILIKPTISKNHESEWWHCFIMWMSCDPQFGFKVILLVRCNQVLLPFCARSVGTNWLHSLLSFTEKQHQRCELAGHVGGMDVGTVAVEQQWKSYRKSGEGEELRTLWGV